ncbi:SET domain-containing protein [Mycena sanguinolenta]|uniref:SET domain-containing protein n=1 Tax=Mycena sanguinolenta TaxID=230812 RepID=A0A8H6ZEG3_9AGAR|nr:SET domain-containing protein [Mycena sanguinolenta]
MDDCATPWIRGTQAFVIGNALITDSGGSSSTVTACAMLLDAPVIPLLPRPLAAPPQNFSPPTFYIADAGVKGAGMFAARDIPAGGLILVDRPIAVVPSDVDAPWKREAFDALLPRISQISRDALLALANCKPLSECPVVEGIALTNAVQIDLPVPLLAALQEYGGVFPNVSRANHRFSISPISLARAAINPDFCSCGLNASVKWDLKSFSVSMYALRPIRAGDEIVQQYVDVLSPRAERRAHLARYDFECMCKHCDLPDEDAVTRSDAARAELRNWRHLQPRFLPWSTDMCRADDAIIVSNLRALALIEQEGLYGLQVPFMEEIALSYAVLGDESRFREWAQQVVDLCAGQDPERSARFAGWIADPQSYKQWGWRAKQRLLLDKQKDLVDVDISIPW